jgi:hypothetical protein
MSVLPEARKYRVGSLASPQTWSGAVNIVSAIGPALFFYEAF